MRLLGAIIGILMLLKAESRPWAVLALILQIIGMAFPVVWLIGIIFDVIAMVVFFRALFR